MTSEKLSTGRSQSRLTVLCRFLFIGLSALILMGCGSLTKHSKAELPLSLTKPCQPLSELEGKTGADLTRKIIEISEAYYQCADQKAVMVEACK